MGEMISAGNWLSFSFSMISAAYTRELFEGGIEDDYFKQKGLRFSAVYDEGGIIAAPGSAIESIQEPLALVGVGEKGFLTLRLTIKGMGGHSSMPPSKKFCGVCCRNHREAE